MQGPRKLMGAVSLLAYRRIAMHVNIFIFSLCSKEVKIYLKFKTSYVGHKDFSRKTFLDKLCQESFGQLFKISIWKSIFLDFL